MDFRDGESVSLVSWISLPLRSFIEVWSKREVRALEPSRAVLAKAGAYILIIRGGYGSAVVHRVKANMDMDSIKVSSILFLWLLCSSTGGQFGDKVGWEFEIAHNGNP